MIPSETSIVWYCWLSRKIETLQKIQNFGAKCLPPVVQVAFWMSSKAIYHFTIMNSIQNCFARWRSSKIFTNYVGLSASQWDLLVVCHLPMNRYWVNKGKYHIWNIEGAYVPKYCFCKLVSALKSTRNDIQFTEKT